METDDVIRALSALAQPTRLEAFRCLIRAHPEGINAGDLARHLDVPQNTASAHLAILTRAGLIEGARQSRHIVYRARLETFRSVADFLLFDCCGGRAEICAPLIDNLTANSPKACSPATCGFDDAARAIQPLQT
jgi:DNA-binding transcriptional ArsR family regulator